MLYSFYGFPQIVKVGLGAHFGPGNFRLSYSSSTYTLLHIYTVTHIHCYTYTLLHTAIADDQLVWDAGC